MSEFCGTPSVSVYAGVLIGIGILIGYALLAIITPWDIAAMTVNVAQGGCVQHKEMAMCKQACFDAGGTEWQAHYGTTGDYLQACLCWGGDLNEMKGVRVYN